MNRRPVPLEPALLITGGSGFVGRAMIRELLRSEPVLRASEIRIFDLHEPFDFPSDPRIRFIRGDIRDKDAVNRAADGVHAVIHLASLVDWGTHPPGVVFDINVEGVRNTIDAVRSGGASAFIYTSSLDAVIGDGPLVDIDEKRPYPKSFPNAYCGSKAGAEKLVSSADDPVGGFRTVNLRPASVWGEADPYHISALVNLAIKGPYVRIGDGKAVQQLVYVGNLAHGHLLAAKGLLDASREGGEATCGGKTYFLTDAPPENFFKFFDSIVEGSGYEIKPKNLWIPKGIMMAAGVLAEGIAWLIRPFKHWNPGVSRFAVNYTCSDFTFTSDAAERDFGFSPVYSRQEAFMATTEWFRESGPVFSPVIPAFSPSTAR
ncbi:MAG: NAD-dependent epimerase/dehydratase family protein [Spirochaetaceae bacterium]|nr:NAD-dependent epimerase/dehydratase family protein [Spirochaetaceae bacterium]MDT8297917.1 NAD-dependent epimerase/dehydratase family protein [Spirochaetaceae bacterium]